jgi:hypothetical protein
VCTKNAAALAESKRGMRSAAAALTAAVTGFCIKFSKQVHLHLNFRKKWIRRVMYMYKDRGPFCANS